MCILLIAIAVDASVLIFFGNILPTWFMGVASLTIGAAVRYKPVKRTLIEITKKTLRIMVTEITRHRCLKCGYTFIWCKGGVVLRPNPICPECGGKLTVPYKIG